MMASALGLAAAMAFIASAQPAQAQAARNADLVIRGGTLYDGSSLTPVIGDAAISGDKIVDVGPEEHTSELQPLMRTSYAVFCVKHKSTLQSQMHNTDAVCSSKHMPLESGQ